MQIKVINVNELVNILEAYYDEKRVEITRITARGNSQPHSAQTIMIGIGGMLNIEFELGELEEV